MIKNPTNKKTNQKGVTLISLAITIIVLLIIISITASVGIETVKDAKLTKFSAELKIMQIEVNALYDAYKNDRTINVNGTDYTGEEILNIGKATVTVNSQAEKVLKGAKIAEENKSGYRYYDEETIKGLQIEGVSEEFFVNVATRSVVSYKGIEYDGLMYYTTEQIPDSVYNVKKETENVGIPTFSAKSSKTGENKWKIQLYDIKYEPVSGGNIKKWKVKYRIKGTEEWNYSDDTTFVVEGEGIYEIKIYNGNIESEEIQIKVSNLPKGVMEENTEYKDSNGDIAIIPRGFKVSDDSEVIIDDGFVIEDKNKNEFVWVPVEDFSEFEREAGYYYTGAKQSFTPTAEGLESEKYYEPEGDGETVDTTASETIQEAQKMYKSVKKNKGFYIGRYETGTTATSGSGIRGKAIVQNNANVYYNIGWSNSTTMTVETGGAVEVARGFDEENDYTNVTSTLCYGVQWDAVMRWMESIENPSAVGSFTKYIQDSTGMGWYSNNHSSGNPTHKAGIDVEEGRNKVKNIYDMAGNVIEWTMEAYDTNNRVFRGGYYLYAGDGYPASYRKGYNPSNFSNVIGFRIALFLEIIDSTVETTPYLPEGAKLTNNDLDTGLTIVDKNGNEWVWIEVPKSITASATTDDEIETALKNYAETLVTNRESYSDTWYNGCGLEESEYNTKKSIMLNSIKSNGGFYIGKYEVGYELKEGESVRSYGTNYFTEYPITQTPVIKENAYPYNWIRCSQAQELSESLATGGKTSSLMFGIQWDLVLKYLSVKENGKTETELTSNSSEWGNYSNKSFDITQWKYSEDKGATWKDVEGTYTKPASSILLTTGATLRNSSMNIYDLAGNLIEWTLEKSSQVGSPCSIRGGAYDFMGSSSPVSHRAFNQEIFCTDRSGFRPSLY